VTTKKRRRHGIAIVIALVVALLLVESAVVVGVFVSPHAADRLRGVAASAERRWNGTGGEPGLRTRTAQTLAESYRSWIEPLWGGGGAAARPAETTDFSACVTCHRSYAKTRRFPSVYMNHPLHAEIGVACETCHPQNAHPNPPRPTEQSCATCHDVTDRTTCISCHPPGSLPHFYLLGAPKGEATDCTTCHPTDSFGTHSQVPKVSGWFNGSDPTYCRQCHSVQAAQGPSCVTCHRQPPHPPNWLSVHGVEAGQGGLNDCYTCHTGTWCGTRCHSVTPSNPTIKQPLPTTGVRP
jgi:hypothetical protein